jgi:anti-sigma factor RsiW
MADCVLPETLLSAWVDGEAGERGLEVQAHVEGCPVCVSRVSQLRQAQGLLRQHLDAAVGDIEPLLALQSIRARVEARNRHGGVARLRELSRELWLFNRPALAGLGVAMALGALTAPFVVLWLGNRVAPPDAVVVESLQVQNNAKAMVVQSPETSTTLIWVEPAGDDAAAPQLRAEPPASPP